MGQQQLLLIVLSVIIVGIAVVVGINMFNSQAASSNLEAVTNDLLNLAARAQQYYVKPTGMGGGGNDFSTLTDITQIMPDPNNENGTYSISGATTTDVTIIGTGNQDGDGDGSDCQITVTVFSDSINTAVDNR